MYNSNVKGWGGISGWQSVPQLLPSVKHVHRFCVFPYHWEWSSVIGIFKSLNIKNSFSFKFIRGCAVSSSKKASWSTISQIFLIKSNQRVWSINFQGRENTDHCNEGKCTKRKYHVQTSQESTMCKHRKKVPCVNIARKYHV